MITRKMALCVIFLLLAGMVQAGEENEAGKPKSEICAGCHGEDGNANAPIFPKLAGQHASYLAKQLRDYKSEKRVEPTMNAMASSLSDAEIADLAAYFAKHQVRPETTEPSPLGEKIYRAGNSDTGVPACSSCHGPHGKGNPQSVYPVLSGQYEAYIEKTLHDYKSGERNNDPNAVMRTIASRLTDDEINAVAAYASGIR